MSDPVRSALIELLEYLMECELFREIEAGCNADGPMARAYEALGEDLPPAMRAFFDEDATDNDGEDA